MMKYWGMTEDIDGDDNHKDIPPSNPTSDLLSPQGSIKVLDNSINFYADISNPTCAELNRILRELEIRMQHAKITMHDPEFDPKIHLRISSYGGDVFSALATVDVMRSMKTKVYTYVEGAAASAATLISIAGAKRYIGKNSFMLIHQLSSVCAGTFERLEDEQENNRRLMQSIKSLYKQYTKIPMKELDNILKRDIWFDAETCLKYGLVDGII
jgi:ATP-dependent protease ClpP protease subunit